MNARKLKKKLAFQETSIFEFRRKKMALNIFEFVEQFMMDNVLLKLTQIEKT